MGLQVRLYLLLGLMLGILYLIIAGVGSIIGAGTLYFYAILALFFVGLQYLIGPAMVSWVMKVRYVSEQEEPDLHRMVGELAQAAGIPKPKVGISNIGIPNAFAFGRTQGDARVCVTEPLRRSLSREELRAVLGHEIGHVKHRDMALITILSVLPMIVYYLAMTFMWSGMFGGRRREGGGYLPLIGIGLLLLYFITNLMVLYASRIREYYADQRSVKLGNQPRHLATALYKLVIGSARVPKEALKQVEGAKAFFASDPSRAWNELRELKEVDADLSGTIDQSELEALRSKTVRPSTGEKILELMSTHPNMLKRIKHLSSLVYDADQYGVKVIR